MLKIFLKKLKFIPEKIALFSILGYQVLLSPDHRILFQRGAVCRFYPTCSEYTLQAIRKFGILKGGLLGIKRISKCHPLNQGGWDPVPKKFEN